MIHGKCVSAGCYAMTDATIEEIYTLVSLALDGGQKQIPIHIFPFMMSPSNMKKNQDSEYFPFWQQLKPHMIFLRLSDVYQISALKEGITLSNNFIL